MLALSPYVACLALVGGPNTTDVMKVDYRSFHIPVQINPDQKGRIKELSLWVSSDRGKTWKMHAKAAPDAKQFRFDTDHDGEYWFNVQVVDTKGTPSPSDMSKAAPALKVVVDTRAKQAPVDSPNSKNSDLDADELEEQYNQMQDAIKRWEKRVAELEQRRKEKIEKELDKMREKLDKLKERARELEKEVSEDVYARPPATCCKPVTISGGK